MGPSSRLLFSTLLRSSLSFQRFKKHPQLSALNIARGSSYKSSPPVRDINEYPEIEVSHNPPEWKFVERLLPPSTVPKPVPRTEYPSGWLPQSNQDIKNLKYFVARTKNYMIPVYLKTAHRGQRRVTVVRMVQGDIWALERELRAVVERARNGRICASRVNEMSGQVQFHGDYVDVVRDYLKERGF